MSDDREFLQDPEFLRTMEVSATMVNRFYVVAFPGYIRITVGEQADNALPVNWLAAAAFPLDVALSLGETVSDLAKAQAAKNAERAAAAASDV